MAVPMAELFLSESVQIIGNNTARVGPSLSHERWEVTHISTNSNSSDLNVPTVQHYRNYVNPSNLLEGTYSGNLDNDTTANFSINSGDSIISTVTGADVNATTWIRFEGKRFIPYLGY